jgi:hypothetical protein
MRARLPTLFLLVPLLAGGWLAAHELAYRLVAPGTHERHELLARSGHGYLHWAQLATTLCVAFVFVGIALAARQAGTGCGETRSPAYRFALLPLLGFSLQEHLERLVQSGGFPVDAVLEPTFVVGLLLQLPLALLAYLLARLLLDAAETLGLALSAIPRRRRFVSARVLVGWAVEQAGASPRPALAQGYSERGPPLPF